MFYNQISNSHIMFWQLWYFKLTNNVLQSNFKLTRNVLQSNFKLTHNVLQQLWYFKHTQCSTINYDISNSHKMFYNQLWYFKFTYNVLQPNTIFQIHKIHTNLFHTYLKCFILSHDVQHFSTKANITNLKYYNFYHKWYTPTS